MFFCQSCGERCASPAALDDHLFRHRGPERLPCLPVARAFERAFGREPTEDEAEQAMNGVPWDASELAPPS